MTSGADRDDDRPRRIPVGFDAHNHQRCVETGLVAAEAHCAAQGLRFTPVRRAALEVLLGEHRAMGAYELLDRLHEAGFGSQPPVAYRALDFLVANGFVHKIERLNAFIACAHPGATHSPAFLICRLCDSVAEAQSSLARGSLGEAAQSTGFRIERTVVEALGVCPACAEKPVESTPA
ncbi:MAG TPA: Fur family transcriptional regulator [Rhodobacteraceae bacterium]|jgi:Fur family zinc uptake transcriptional regulator|nr:Fur family transcriptional regulator [Paracoccaceae bacterium]